MLPLLLLVLWEKNPRQVSWRPTFMLSLPPPSLLVCVQNCWCWYCYRPSTDVELVKDLDTLLSVIEWTWWPLWGDGWIWRLESSQPTSLVIIFGVCFFLYPTFYNPPPSDFYSTLWTSSHHEFPAERFFICWFSVQYLASHRETFNSEVCQLKIQSGFFLLKFWIFCRVAGRGIGDIVHSLRDFGVSLGIFNRLVCSWNEESSFREDYHFQIENTDLHLWGIRLSFQASSSSWGIHLGHKWLLPPFPFVVPLLIFIESPSSLYETYFGGLKFFTEKARIVSKVC